MEIFTTVNPKSVKAKGRALQNLLRDKLRKAFPDLHEDDIKSQTMGMTGEDIVLSPHARKLIPYSISSFILSNLSCNLFASSFVNVLLISIFIFS